MKRTTLYVPLCFLRTLSDKAVFICKGALGTARNNPLNWSGNILPDEHVDKVFSSMAGMSGTIQVGNNSLENGSRLPVTGNSPIVTNAFTMADATYYKISNPFNKIVIAGVYTFFDNPVTPGGAGNGLPSFR